MLHLRGYRVVAGEECGYEFLESVLVFAWSANAALQTGSPYLTYLGDSDVPVKAERRKDLDEYRRPWRMRGYTETEPERLRDAGWCYSDEDTCTCCGLGAMGIDQYWVCQTCLYCPECAAEANQQGDGGCPECSATVARYKAKAMVCN